MKSASACCEIPTQPDERYARQAATSPVGVIPQDRLFTWDGYAELLSGIRAAGYEFLRFLDVPNAGTRSFYLRHDVDFSPRGAARMGQIEAEAGIRANYFFMLNPGTYLPLSVETLSILRDLRRDGHCVGLHVDGVLFDHDEPRIRETLRWFSECVQTIDPVISFHRPDRMLLGKAFTGFVSAYATEFFGQGRYFSDSRRNHEFNSQLKEQLTRHTAPIQLLLHPIWWEVGRDLAGYHRSLRIRHVEVVDRYLRENCPKVFGGIVDSARSAEELL